MLDYRECALRISRQSFGGAGKPAKSSTMQDEDVWIGKPPRLIQESEASPFQDTPPILARAGSCSSGIRSFDPGLSLTHISPQDGPSKLRIVIGSLGIAPSTWQTRLPSPYGVLLLNSRVHGENCTLSFQHVIAAF